CRLTLKDRIAVQPFDEVLLAAPGDVSEPDAGAPSSVCPNNFALAFDHGTGGQLEGKRYRSARLKQPEGTDRHPIFAQVSGQRPMLHAIIVNTDWDHQLVA